MQEARVHALLMQGLRIMGCIEALADAAELLIYARQVANPVAHTCKVKEELSKLEQWAIRLDKVAWPQDPQYAVPSTIADRIEKWMQQYMLLTCRHGCKYLKDLHLQYTQIYYGH